MKRRDLFKLGALTGATLLLPAQRLVAAATGQPHGIAAFTVPLRIPPVLHPYRRTLHTDFYHVTQREADVEILPGTTTRLYTYNGAFPGPTIRAVRGRQVVIHQTNALPVHTSVHLHGAHVAPDSDGHPTDLIHTGHSKDYRYPNTQLAATLWYHDHAHHGEAESVFRGLAGFYLIRDLYEHGLPSGKYDIPLMFRDIHLDERARVVYQAPDPGGRNIVLVNGVPQPFFRVAARKYRLRLLNAANDRAFKFALSNGANLVQIASDGGLLPATVTTPVVELWPAERAEVIVDFSRLPIGAKVVLRNQFGESDAAVNLLRFEVTRRASDHSRIPTDRELPDLPPLGLRNAVHRDVTVAFDPAQRHFTLNGKTFDPDRVDFTVRQNQLEVWTVRNTDPVGFAHNFHVHLVQFRVLDRNGAPPPPGERGWKDTVTVGPGQTVRIASRFTGYTGRYVFHCHLIDHATAGMMGQLEVVR
ncbi:MAG TPA: multicopper oxidase domain-containing protein [Actinophytocola sp.]|uniref:multicopper oxidase family protein n=1 Tax=Actinophytocola sp. TaxID=1872138 RepID=UPI002DDD4AD9|nr:multicopper oxidase domain-containing protein [Actinophytocola sp.]HEV2783290.1 multicopper oxidase domain-containing protein [Actinophytocola sp.]